MKMWINLDEKVIKAVMEITKAKDISEAVNIALKEYIKLLKAKQISEKK
jgi:Arc/MetJ family transcription regulator